MRSKSIIPFAREPESSRPSYSLLSVSNEEFVGWPERPCPLSSMWTIQQPNAVLFPVPRSAPLSDDLPSVEVAYETA